jgi:uncharacterized protein
MEEIIFNNCIGFEWDISNETKNWKKHAVTKWECEQVFFNKPLLIYEDKKHSQKENRAYVLGQTDQGRKLFIVFTIRNRRLRIISARSMSKKERAFYEKA